MRTDELVTMLATGVEAVDAGATRRRYVTALMLGAAGAALMMGALLGVRHDLALAALQPMFWIKIAYVAVLALASAVALRQLLRPGTRFAAPVIALAVPVLAMWALSLFELGGADAPQRESLLVGNTAASCPWLIAALSLPTFGALLWAVPFFAPTRLRLTGAAIGFLSAATGAVAYSLHCPEMAAPFLGSWYLLGMLIPALIGALIGPRILRW